MKYFYLILLIQVSVGWSASDHSGHKHKVGEECEVSGMPSPEGADLASDALSAAAALNPDQRYCDAMAACGGGGFAYDSGLLSSMSCEIKTKATCGLEAREVAAIQFYTSSGYRCINQYIWGKEEGPKQGAVDILNEALSKLPRHEGFVMRGTSLPEAIRNQHKEGETVTYDAFTSTSTNSGFTGRDQFLIYSRTGRPIMSLSKLSGEDEVLFASGTQFRVVRVKGDHTRHYILREVTGTETASEARAEDQRILGLAQAMKDASSSPTSVVMPRAQRRWECPDGSQEIPAGVQLQTQPHNIGSFL